MNEKTNMITPKERQELLKTELVKNGWKILRDDFDIPYAVQHKDTGKFISFYQVSSFFLLTNRVPEA